MRTTPVRSADCGLCYGIGCYSCGYLGTVSTQEDFDAFEEACERRADEARDDRLND